MEIRTAGGKPFRFELLKYKRRDTPTSYRWLALGGGKETAHEHRGHRSQTKQGFE